MNVLLLLRMMLLLLILRMMMRMMMLTRLLAVVSRTSVRPHLDLGPVVHETAKEEPPKEEVRALDHDDSFVTTLLNTHGPWTDDR